MPRRLRSLTVVVTLVVAACGGSSEPTTSTAEPATTTTGAVDSTTTSTTVVAGEVIDWEDRTVVATLPEGWSVTGCEGSAPLMCVSRDDEVVGLLEAFLASPSTFEIWDPTADDETTLRAIAANYVSTFVEDRAVGCGAGYVVEPLEPRPIVLGGTPGLTYGFRGTAEDGTPSELHIQYAAISADRLIVVTAAAYDEGGCPGKDDLISFDTATLEGFAPHLDRLMEASPLPWSDTSAGLVLPDGSSFAWIVGDGDEGLLVDPAFLLTGEAARKAAVDAGVIGEGEELPNDVFIWNPTEEPFTVRLADLVRWSVIGSNPEGELEPVEVDRDAIRAILAGTYDGGVYGLAPEFMPFNLVVAGGEVIEVTQVYLP